MRRWSLLVLELTAITLVASGGPSSAEKPKDKVPNFTAVVDTNFAKWDKYRDGDGGDIEVFRLMAKHSVALCPTLAASEAISKYRGWKKETEPEPTALKTKRASLKEALEAGVIIVKRQRRWRLRPRRQCS